MEEEGSRRRPSDAVLCECSVLAARRTNARSRTKAIVVNPRTSSQRRFRRFIESIVRKVFDNQRKSPRDVSLFFLLLLLLLLSS
ncbi:hypothetical protein B9Z55_022407 [Caenorhabditis nigoni]|uniref:Uncharacterized protein n=1 Tax=Caenorhabditis nigoni TaxID=1611254 RepID=A0A2G5SK49_9PELO|nr:hypothetical protein B9Z55_022407 [Caenorhabditis nigoni]